MMDDLEFRLERKEYTQDTTIGELSVNGFHLFYTLEDIVRSKGVKVKGKTAIPAGRYQVQNTWSPKYQRIMPLIMDVPMFQGIRIHGGNDEDDTEGCVLVGLFKQTNRIHTCKPALDVVYSLINAAELLHRKVWITVEDTKVIE